MADLLDAFNAAAGFAGNVASDMDRMLQVEAQTKLQNMQLNFEKSTDDFLMKLQDSNDYENWQTRADDYLQKQSDGMQAQAGNQYTARMAQQMMAQNRVSLMQKVAGAAHDGIQKNIRVTDAQNIALAEQNYTGQQQLDAKLAVYDKEYAYHIDGYDSARYQNDALAAANQVVYDGYTKQSDDIVDRCFSSGQSWADARKQIDALQDSITFSTIESSTANPEMLESGGTRRIDQTNLIDKKAIKQKVASAAAAEWTARVKQAQDENAGKLSQIYMSMETENNPKTQLSYLRQGQLQLRTLNGNQLDEKRRNEYARYFKAAEEAITESGGGSGASDKRIQNLMNIAKVSMPGFVSAAIRGQDSREGGINSIYTAQDAFVALITDKGHEIGVSDDDIALVRSQYLNDFANACRDEISSYDKQAIPAYMAGSARIQTLAADWAKKNAKGDKSAESQLAGEAAGRFFDYWADSVNGSIDGATAVKKADQIVAELTSKQLDIERLGKNGEASFKGSLGEGLHQLAQKDYGWTNGYQAEQFNVAAEQNVREKLNSQASTALKALGVDVSGATVINRVQNGKHEEDLGIQVKAGGKTYTFVSTGKNSYEVRDENGTVLGTDKDVTKKADALDAAQHAAAKTGYSAAKKGTSYRDTGNVYIDIPRKVRDMPKSPVTGVTDAQWRAADVDQRTKWVMKDGNLVRKLMGR